MTHPPIKAPFELPQTEAGTLYEHEDGRYAVAHGTESPAFTHGDPKWHRVGPVDVSALSHPAAQAGAVQAVSDERAAFEAEIRKDAGDLSTFGSGSNLHYCNSAVNNAWGGWKARAALAATQPSAVPGDAVAKVNRYCSAGMCVASDAEHDADCRRAAPGDGQGAMRKGYVAVPMRLTRAMQDVLENESWEWADLLMMAEATTEEEDAAIRRFESLDLLEKAEREAAEQQAYAAELPPSLHPATADLVRRFSYALGEKLAAAEKKYAYSDGWLSPDWMDECRSKLIEHVAKGDPRDVAAYCAFLWHHGENTFVPTKAAPYEALMNEVMACGGEVTPQEVIFDHATLDIFMQRRVGKTALDHFADEVEATLPQATDEMFAEFSAIDNSLSAEDMRKIIERILALTAPGAAIAAREQEGNDG